jgi:alkylation response protein AidB-like acyl-CoA dehydrogenase
MNLDDSPQEAVFRSEIRDWFGANAPAFQVREHMSLAEEVALGRAWQARKAAAGYAAIHWSPEHGGRGASAVDVSVLLQEEGRYLLPVRAYITTGLNLAMPTLFAHGDARQVATFARPTLEGRLLWCQLFSEPDAGSDLAGLRTRAIRVEGGWRINGEKVWTSYADHADWGILVARSNPELPKHAGLTFFVVDMHSPGIEIRPIKRLTGGSEFSQVLLTDVLIPDDNRVGPPEAGWSVVMTTLSNERFNIGTKYRANTATVVRLAARTPLAGRPALQDPVIRERIALLNAREQAVRFFGYRIRTALQRGEPLGARVAINKLVIPKLAQDTGDLAMEICGYAGLVDDADTDEDIAKIRDTYFLATAQRIAGGTDEIMRNQIAERVLGLPQEQRPDKSIPFDQLK